VNATFPAAPELIEWHSPRLVPLLDRFEKDGALHTTLLFTGVEGVGKKSVALHFIQLLFCDRSIFAGAEEPEDSLFGGPAPVESPKSRVACGECGSCIRASRGQWLDLIWIDPETDEEGKRLGTHKIKAFRELKEKLGLGPAEEPFRVVVIADADRMNQESANSILKVLEEPPKNWLFILTASDASRLLPTILSRCMEIKFSPLEPDRIFSILKRDPSGEFPSRRAKVASRAAMGSISRAKSCLEEETWELRDRLIGLLSNPAAEWMGLIDTISTSQIRLGLTLDLMETILMDLLSHRIKGDQHLWIHEDQKEPLIEIADRLGWDIARLVRTLEGIAERRKHTGLTLNAKLLAQEILAPWMERS
jgi:DNA polymerase-3 subunit delta'